MHGLLSRLTERIFSVKIQHNTEEKIVSIEENNPAIEYEDMIHEHVHRDLVEGVPRLQVHHHQSVLVGGSLDDEAVEPTGGQDSVIV